MPTAHTKAGAHTHVRNTSLLQTHMAVAHSRLVLLGVCRYELMYAEEERTCVRDPATGASVSAGCYGVWGHRLNDLCLHSISRLYYPRHSSGGGVLWGTDDNPVKRIMSDAEVVWEIGIDSSTQSMACTKHKAVTRTCTSTGTSTGASIARQLSHSDITLSRRHADARAVDALVVCMYVHVCPCVCLCSVFPSVL